MSANHPDDRTILNALDDDDAQASLECLWVFSSGVLVGVFLACIVVFIAIYLACFHPEFQQLQ